MTDFASQLSNPFSTGGGGVIFETHVQASFVALMLTGGFAPCVSCLPIVKIKLQGKKDGYDTDDFILFAESVDGKQKQKVLGQIKHSIGITQGNTIFRDVIRAAWNDFNNPGLFTKEKDVFALITGPLSATDIDAVRPLLEWARHSENAEDFFKQVALPKFSSEDKAEKLKAFREHLKTANGDRDVSDEELFSFLRHFHLLGYDLDIRAGVTLSLIHSLIGQYSPENARSLWTSLVDEVQSANKNAGTITLAMLTEELRSAFQKRSEKEGPSVPAATTGTPPQRNWNLHPDASDLAIASLLGSWDEKSKADIAIIEKLSKKDFPTWLSRIREILQQPDSPVAIKNGVWTVPDRKNLWQAIGARIFDSYLDTFKECAIAVLGERDPKFDLLPEERFAASLHKKVLAHSEHLRKGITETLALLGSCSSALTYCSLEKAEGIAALAVREIFADADYVGWGSLNHLLPVIAEAAPGEFLGAVGQALVKSPSPFDTLFQQEGSGVTGTNYLTGLLWALETLAWDEQSLVGVSVLLGKLALHDPGGNWANRPSNSLTTIFLPWFPQTRASIEKRKVAVQTLSKEVPAAAWKLLLSLLPSTHQMSMGAHKPEWRDPVPDKWKPKVLNAEYIDQTQYYSSLAVDSAEGDVVKLAELTTHIGNLPKPSFEKLLSVLTAKSILEKPEQERLPLWENLVEFILQHRRFADAKWALSPELLAQIEDVSKALAPKNPIYLHHRLFDGHASDFYEENGNWQEQDKRIQLRRQEAIKEVLSFGGYGAVIEFTEKVKYPSDIGISLGLVAENRIDAEILPGLLTTDTAALKQFVSGFIWGRFRAQGWTWVDSLEVKNWTCAQISQFLAWLPATDETWKRVVALLGAQEKDYWALISVGNPYQIEGDLIYAVDKLLEYGRPKAAIGCLHRIVLDKKSVDPVRTIKALLAAVSSGEPIYAMDAHDAGDLIKALQDSKDSDKAAVSLVEWAYLQVLGRESHEASPKMLEQKLSSDPKFFCEILRFIYRSKKIPKSDEEPTEQKKQIASNAHRLLSEWQTPPGMEPNGSFNAAHFRQWLKDVKEECEESGHIEVALIQVGAVLLYSPPDAGGLWINKVIAEELNKSDAEDMRNGYRTEIYNSRGVHWIDPTGKPELELSAKYKKQADDVENAGYQYLASMLRGLAKSYERDAERVISEHRSET